MATPTSESIAGELRNHLEAREELVNWAFAQTRPPLWMLLLLPLILVPMIVLGRIVADIAIGAGLIEVGPMMPVVMVLGGFPVLGPYLYLGLRRIRTYAVGTTPTRLLVADLKADPQVRFRAYPLDARESFSGSTGLVPKLKIRSGGIVHNLQFPLTIKGNKEQAIAIVQRLTGGQRIAAP